MNKRKFSYILIFFFALSCSAEKINLSPVGNSILEKGEGVQGIDLINLMIDWLGKRNINVELNTRAVKILKNSDANSSFE